jgi:TetR/AcrR family transcriptional regulator, transcriptional repressor for nem operon
MASTTRRQGLARVARDPADRQMDLRRRPGRDRPIDISDQSATIGGMPRPPNPDVRRRLLAAGLDLVHRRGFAASGIKDITDSAGVPKGSFYAYFASKEAFAAALLEHYWADIEHRILPLLDAAGPAQERVTRFFHALADEHEAGDFLLGCLIGNLSLELGGSSDAVRDELASILDRWEAALTTCVRAGQHDGDGIRADLAAGDLAAMLIEAWEGAALRGKVTRSRAPYARFETVTVEAMLR